MELEVLLLPSIHLFLKGKSNKWGSLSKKEL
jgi:hypothetical protein